MNFYSKINKEFNCRFQTAGTGPIRPNTIVIGWYNSEGIEKAVEFVS